MPGTLRVTQVLWIDCCSQKLSDLIIVNFYDIIIKVVNHFIMETNVDPKMLFEVCKMMRDDRYNHFKKHGYNPKDDKGKFINLQTLTPENAKFAYVLIHDYELDDVKRRENHYRFSAYPYSLGNILIKRNEFKKKNPDCAMIKPCEMYAFNYTKKENE